MSAIRIEYCNKHTGNVWQAMHTPPKFKTLAEAEAWLDEEMLRWEHGTAFRIMVMQSWLEGGILYEVDAPHGRWEI